MCPTPQTKTKSIIQGVAYASPLKYLNKTNYGNQDIACASPSQTWVKLIIFIIEGVACASLLHTLTNQLLL